MRWGPPFYRKKRAETLAYYKHVISYVISNNYLYKICTSNYVVFVMFFVIISDFPKLFCATGSKMFKGFQRLSQTFSRTIKNIQTTNKEWYPQALQTKQNVHIILQQLGPPFPRGKKGENMKLSTFQANHLVLHFIDMPLFVGPSGFHSIEIGVPFFRDLL